MTTTATDEQDVRDMVRLAEGHESALNNLMERHAERVFHYLLRSLQNEEDAADLAQETFVRVYQNRTRFDPKQKFTTWLYTIAGNLVRDRFRWRARHPQVSLDAETDHEEDPLRDKLPATGDTPDDVLQKNERSEAVRHAVAALPEELKEPLILTVYEGLSHIEVAEILKCTPKAVESRIYRARQQLRERLGKILPGL